MNRVVRNQQFLRDLYARRAHRPAWICLPPSPDLCGDRDYSLGLQPLTARLPELVAYYQAQVALLDAVDHDLVPCTTLITGTQLMAQAFGCAVHTFVDNNPCAVALVSSAAEAAALRRPRVEDCPNLMRVLEMAALLEKELGRGVPMSICDVQSGFDTACLIWEKSDFLCAMVETPDEVKRLCAMCADLLRDFLRLLRHEFPSVTPCHCPGGWVPPELGVWVSNDECGALSVAMFEEFCLPELITLAESFGGLGMHCCADAEHQFPSFRKIPNFYGFNRVAAKHGYLPLLEHFGGDSGPVFTQAWMSDAQIAEVLAQAPHGTHWSFYWLGVDAEQAARRIETVEHLLPRRA